MAASNLNDHDLLEQLREALAPAVGRLSDEQLRAILDYIVSAGSMERALDMLDLAAAIARAA
jgi:hypothetical protein